MRARPGEAVKAFADLLEVETDDCVEWPFSVSSAGYGQMGIDGTVRNVHMMACEHHHGPRPDGYQTAHGRPDGTPCVSRRCMNYRHLNWKSPAENNADMVTHGTRARGSRSGNSKLTDDMVHDIRGRVGQTQAAIAAEFGVNQVTVGQILRRVRWAWLPEREASVHVLPAAELELTERAS